MILKPFVTFIKPAEPSESAVFALSILTKYQIQLEDYWSFEDLVYLLALESEGVETEQRIREVVQMSPLVLNALKSTIRNETRREFVSQTLPKLLIYIKSHPEIARQPIWIHQHQQILKLIQKQSKLLQAQPNKRVWENGELLPLVSKSELRQSGRRKSIQTLIKLIRSVETYYVDNNGPKAPQKALTINQYNAQNKEEIIKKLTQMLIKTYGLTPESDAKKNNAKQEVQKQKRDIRTKELAYRTNVVLNHQEKAPKTTKETIKTLAKYIPKWIDKEASTRLKRAEMSAYHINQKDVIQKLEVLLHPKIYQNHRLSKVSRTLERITENRSLSRLAEVTAKGQHYTLKPRDSERLYEELSHYYDPNRFKAQDEEVENKQAKDGLQLSNFVNLITKREEIKLLMHQFQTLNEKTSEIREESEHNIEHYLQTELIPKVSEQSSQMEQIKRISKNVFEEWKAEVSERVNLVSTQGLSPIEKIEKNFTADMLPSKDHLGSLVTTAVDDSALNQMTDLVINRVVDQVFNRVTEKIDRERRRRGL